MQNIQSNEQRNPIDAIHAKARERVRSLRNYQNIYLSQSSTEKGTTLVFFFLIKKAKYKKTYIYINIFIHTHV